MGFLSKFEGKMEDTVEGMASSLGGSSLSPVQITKKAEKQMRREKMVGAGAQYAPTLYTVLVSPDDDARMFGYYPTLAGEVETYLMAKAAEIGLMMDGQPLVRFLADPELKRGKFDVVAEMVSGQIISRLRNEEMQRYGLAQAPAGPRAAQRPGGGRPMPQPRGVQPTPYAQQQPAYMPPSYDDYGYDEPAYEEDTYGEPAYIDPGYADPGYTDPAYAEPAYGHDYHDDYADPYAAAPAPAPARAAGPPKTTVMAPTPAPTPQPAAPEADVYLYDAARDRAYELTGRPQRIGRESANDIVVPDINVSRVHAEIRRDSSGAWIVSDLGSTNGVFVNNRQVKSAPLRDADMILLGTTELEFQLLS